MRTSARTRLDPNICGILPLVAALTVGCGDLTGPDSDPTARLGYLDIGHPDDPLVTLPDKVAAGQDFEIRIRTWGSNSCYDTYRTVVEIDPEDLRVLIEPYDHRASHGGCLQMMWPLTHTVTLRFDKPGTATIWTRGQWVQAERHPLDLVLRVTVTPK